MSNEQLSNIYQNAKSSVFSAADKVDDHFDSLASSIRSGWNNSSWLPSSVKGKSVAPLTPAPPPPPASTIARIVGRSDDGGGILGWVKEHKAITGALIAAVGLGGALWISRRRKTKSHKRRKAARASNGGRKEIVVIHGAPQESLVKSLALDLEKRGFIVFVVASTKEDETCVLNEGRTDIRPLVLDILDPQSAQTSVDKFAQFLRAPSTAFHSAIPHHLRLTSVIVIPDAHYPTGPIETIPMDVWSDTFNLKLVQTLAITQLFMPLLADYKARILFITPSIPHSLSLPFHAPEVATMNALGGVITALRREVRPSGVKVVWLKTGNFDFGGVSAATAAVNRQALTSSTRADVLQWPPHIRAAYGRNYTTQRNPGAPGTARGSSAKELHFAVFDAMAGKHARDVWRIGSGSVVYDVLGQWAPEGMIGWMLGFNKPNFKDIKGTKGSARESSPGGGGGLEASVEWEKL